MSFSDILKGIGKAIGEDIVDDFKGKVDDTLEDAKEKVVHTTEIVIKKVIGLCFVLIGVIFGLVGLSKYLSSAVAWMGDGIGYVVVGVFLLLLGWFANYMSK